MSISSYMREQRDLELAEGGAAGPEGAPVAYEQDQPSISQHLVCKPHNRNITSGCGPGEGVVYYDTILLL